MHCAHALTIALVCATLHSAAQSQQSGLVPAQRVCPFFPHLVRYNPNPIILRQAQQSSKTSSRIRDHSAANLLSIGIFIPHSFISLFLVVSSRLHLFSLVSAVVSCVVDILLFFQVSSYSVYYSPLGKLLFVSFLHLFLCVHPS